MRIILAVAPHPDDETLGCGGTLLRHRAEGDEIHWLIATRMTAATGYTAARRRKRAAEIRAVASRYGFKSTIELGFETASLDAEPRAKVITRFATAIRKISPNVVYLPFPGDPHSDHRIVYETSVACTKSFRLPSIERVLCYEALSETDFALDPSQAFHPNVYSSINGHLDGKLEILRLYDQELGRHPFPRSEASVRALAALRGSASGFAAAEAFMLMKERR